MQRSASNDEGMSFGGTADPYILKLKELVKAYFANPDYAVQRLLALFGVDKARVALRG